MRVRKQCIVSDCESNQLAAGFCHFHRLRSNREPRTEPIGYTQAHRNVINKKQYAQAHICFCGEQAYAWALINESPNALTDKRGRRYSLNTDDYVAMCRSCHQKMDNAWRKVNA